MLKGKSRALVALVVAAIVLALASPAFAVQKKSKKKKAVPRGTPVLWRAHNIESLDLAAGPGGTQMRPVLRNLRLIKEEKGGWSKKYRVRDASGREWVAKLGREAQSETAAARLVWAAGYETEISYLVPRATIPGKGTFTNVRFEARPKSIKRFGVWTWKNNPFAGTRELQGLKVLMALINNWDLKDDNNVLLQEGGELRYAISDLGATFGKGGGLGPLWRVTRSRNNPEDYADSGNLVNEVEGGYVDIKYVGVNKGIFDKISVEDARWVGRLLARLSDKQLADAFRAANYTPAQTRLLAETVRARINELVNLPRRTA
ncbi:MAG TPA: hypothetical protein VEX60_08550 [Pyrinomonadaceae bacterium]|nr:hypothetical protein [Pyrinomonadaceae bacterium]